MNCEQTRENLVLHQQDPKLKGIKRSELLKHLRGCDSCQIEYEGLLHTAEVIGNLEDPEPPPELLSNIQNQVRQLHRRSRTALLASPFSWLFGKLKLELSPQIVNCTALVCYLLASVFLVKFAFFTDVQDDGLGLTAMEETRLRNVRISPSPWGSLKHQNIRTGKTETTSIPKVNSVSPSNKFVDTKIEEMWYSNTINEGTETVDVPFIDDAGVKLTLFWNDIKSNL